MDARNKPRDTKHNRKADGRFSKKEIKHDPQAESARTKFGMEQYGYNNPGGR